MADMMRHLNPSSAPEPRGEYTHAVVADQGACRLVFVGGQVGLDPGGQPAVTFEEQFDLTFANVGRVLEAAGASFATLVQLTTYLTSAELIEPYFAKRRAVFPELFGGRYPTNALVIVAGLARPQLQLEVQGIAIMNSAGT